MCPHMLHSCGAVTVTAILVINFQKNFERGVIFYLKSCIANLELLQPVYHEFMKKMQYIFPRKGRGGSEGVKGFSEIF